MNMRNFPNIKLLIFYFYSARKNYLKKIIYEHIYIYIIFFICINKIFAVNFLQSILSFLSYRNDHLLKIRWQNLTFINTIWLLKALIVNEKCLFILFIFFVSAFNNECTDIKWCFFNGFNEQTFKLWKC